VTGRVILTGEAQIVPDVRKNDDFLPCCPTTLSEIAVPIVEEGGVLGAISLESDLLAAFDQSDLDNLNATAKLAVLSIQRARAAAELKDAYEKLKLEDERKSWFQTVLSHELRAPLASVRLFIEAILKRSFGYTTPALRSSAEAALNRIDEETGLIENLLEMVKIHEQPVLLLSSSNITILLERVYETFRRPCAQKGIVLSLDTLPGRDLTVQIDEGKIKQVLNNLVSNALKFTPTGGQVHLSACSEGENIVVRVKDTGIGIPAQALPRIFEEFFQAGGHDVRRDGLGLGLTIVKQYVDLHSGTIMVKSELNGGSEFTVTLPICGPATARDMSYAALHER